MAGTTDAVYGLLDQIWTPALERAKLLSRGGSEDGMSLYRAFRGADPDKRAMLRSRGLWTPEPPSLDSLEVALLNTIPIVR